MNKTIELIHAIQAMMKEAGALGVTLIALLTAITALLTANVVLPKYGGVDTQPLSDEQDINVVFAPDGGEQVIFCRDGWQPLPASDTDLVVLGCTDGDPEDLIAGDWLVVLEQDGETFNVAYQWDTPGADFIFVEAEVPGWLD